MPDPALRQNAAATSLPLAFAYLCRAPMSVFRKLLSVVPYPLFPTTSAGRKSILHFNSHLSKLADVTVAGVRYDRQPSVGFRLRELFSQSKLRYINPANLFRIRREAARSGTDFVLFEHPYMAWMGLFLGQRRRLRWGIRSHNIEYARFRDFGKWWWPVLKWCELYLYKKADAVFFITEADCIMAQSEVMIRHAFIMPTGMLIGSPPTDAAACRAFLRETYGIRPDEKILLYNGALDYQPNREALDAVLDQVNPILEGMSGFSYRIIICGSSLDPKYDELRAYASHNVIYCGFVPDITVYFKGADLYLNPVIGGGGIKTRLVEAIAYNTNVVSTMNGSIGFNNHTVEDKVRIVPDGDWNAFANAIVQMCSTQLRDTTPTFYDYYYWDNIVRRFAAQVNAVTA